MLRSGLINFNRSTGLASAALLVLAYAGTASAAESKAKAPGRIEFDHPSTVAPNVSVDLPAGLFRDIAGLGDAALAGIVDGLLKQGKASGASDEDVKLVSEHLSTVRKIVSTIGGAVDEVRVRAYKGGVDKDGAAADVAKFYANKLKETSWDRVVEAHEGEKTASVYLMRDDGALRGIFVVAAKDHDLVLANVVCDVSPDRVKEITEQAVTMGLKLGGDEALREIVGELRGGHERHEAPHGAQVSR